MQISYIQLLYALVLLTNLIVLSYFLIKTRKRKNGRDGDDEGGLEIYESPELDLPPGVILPRDMPVKETIEV